MASFETPSDLQFNRGLIADPEGFARDAHAASWLFLCGEEFAGMEGGMSYASVQAAVPRPPISSPIRPGRSTWSSLERTSPHLTSCLGRPS